MRYAQLVMGPAGSGKSTYCHTIAVHGEVCKRRINVVNLDPAAEHFQYEAMADIRDLIHLDDAMEDEDLHFGPNGGLVFCMEYLVSHSDWLQEQLGDEVEDDYILFDCPGQIELYTHLPVMKDLVDVLEKCDFRVCGVFLLDSQFLIEASKFFSGVMAALSTMVNLEIPHVSVLTKMDLLSKVARKQIARYLEPDPHLLIDEEPDTPRWGTKHQRLSEAIGKLIEDYSLVQFLPLDRTNEESIEELLFRIDNAIQYGENLDVKVKNLERDDLNEDLDDS